MPTPQHFTAVLEITQTERPPAPTPTTGYRNDREPAPTLPPREVRDVARIVVRADTLEALAAKLTAHVALVAD